MMDKGMNCAAKRSCGETEQLVEDMKKRKNNNKHYDFVHDEFIDLNVEHEDYLPMRVRFKKAMPKLIKDTLVTIFALGLVISFFILLYKIIS